MVNDELTTEDTSTNIYMTKKTSIEDCLQMVTNELRESNDMCN